MRPAVSSLYATAIAARCNLAATSFKALESVLTSSEVKVAGLPCIAFPLMRWCNHEAERPK